ncbi:MAG TPA: 16S rRNA (guanine(966)-N(2))-methyltransferase RsmD [Nannocystaceae bacterium]|nr:16S rRNA (guanine(966)-N(2))-methyltransferase RsmD [Nannocystaceae bacterium]
MQRISAGRFRGRKLLPIPEGALGVRPTGSRVREAIFDRLQDSVIGASVLDLFAGSGALAFEALSRGAKRAVLVERDPSLVRRLRSQIEALGAGAEAEVWAGEALTFLRDRGHRSRLGRFDLVLIDPPYAEAEALCGPALALLADGWLAPDADLVVEYARHRGRAPVIAHPRALEILAQRTYGETAVDFLRGPAAEG